VRAEPTNTRTTGIDTYHSTMFTARTQRYMRAKVDTVRMAK